jgi:Rieske Fe-S protein
LVGDDYSQAIGQNADNPADWRSAPEANGNIYQFRMQDGDHGTIGSHVHFQQFDPDGNEILNRHIAVNP